MQRQNALLIVSSKESRGRKPSPVTLSLCALYACFVFVSVSVLFELNGDVGHLVLFVDAFHDSRNDFPWAQLVARLQAALEESAEGGLPLHGGGHLHGEDRFDDLGVAVGLGIHVGIDWNPRCLDLSLREDLLQLLHGAVHVLRVEGPRHGKPHRHPGLELRLCLRFENLDGLDRARDRVIAVAQKVRNLDGLPLASLLRGRFAELLDLVGLQPDDAAHGSRPGVRCRLHGLSPRLDDLQAVLKA
mmetsp:Transcript_11511/g.31946  ORF Transcript_11511/g.31946 Transcript_11511/m.31946 type:complete len:245 (+) Transcript_11511:62-796(+)